MEQPQGAPGARRRIVILGGGFGGAYCAQALEKRLDPDEAEIFLIDRNNYFIFYPLLVEAGTGSLEPRHAVVSIRSFLKRTVFRLADVEGVDFAARRVTFRAPEAAEPESVPYDHLVLALGSVTRLPNVPGLHEFGFEMKNMADAVGLRDRAIRLLEIADATADPELRRELLQFVVVGGNFSGVEVAGEFHAFLRRAARQYRNVDPRECNLTLVERGDRILNILDEDLSAYATRSLERRGVKVLTSVSAARLSAHTVELSNGQTLPARTVIWCAGIAPNPLLAKLGLPLDANGYVPCEPDIRVKGFDNVWGIGDCAVNPGPDGQPNPATAQHALREGKVLAENLAHALRGEPLIVKMIPNQGSLAALGCRTAVAKVFGFKFSGFIAWFLWRSVYLMKMPGWTRRIRIALDWTMDLFFPHDYVQLGLHRRQM